MLLHARSQRTAFYYVLPCMTAGDDCAAVYVACCMPATTCSCSAVSPVASPAATLGGGWCWGTRHAALSMVILVVRTLMRCCMLSPALFSCHRLQSTVVTDYQPVTASCAWLAACPPLVRQTRCNATMLAN